jgi:hypothetical protein
VFQEYFATSGLLVWPLAGFAIFFVAFLVVLVWVFVGWKDRASLDHVASLPLEPDAAPGEPEPGRGDRHGR